MKGKTVGFKPDPAIHINPASPYFNLTTSLPQEGLHYEHSTISRIQASKIKAARIQIAARFPTCLVGSSFPAQLPAGSSLLG
jgi:hypothetical protein